MIELSADNALAYLQQTSRLPAGTSARVSPLAWGVSNVVLRVEPDGHPALIVKQSQPKLRTKIEWRSRCERIYREADVLRAYGTILPVGAVPKVLFEDRENFVLGLEAVRADHVVWKQALLERRLDGDVAETLGRYLAWMHARTWERRDLLPDADDWSLFDELRIDPYYRWLARRAPEMGETIDDLIDEMADHRVCLVHADFSPKNVLVHADGVTLVDFETGHYGDPAFDVGFFLAHLVLKTLRQRERAAEWMQLVARFWSTYLRAFDEESSGERRGVSPPCVRALPETPGANKHGGLTPRRSPGISQRAVRHLAACLWARVDGKSPVDYLHDPADQEFVRGLARRWVTTPPERTEHALAEVFFDHLKLCGELPT
jgi:tRNA A-37 threonylcarbamoyl transferase component Bud32